ncbi:MAG TPA: choice-of-anchor D domain-containing protein [Streptosporangiaceae bacterium]
MFSRRSPGRRILLSVLLAAGVTGSVTTIASAAPTPSTVKLAPTANTTKLFLITPTSLDFGYVPVGSTTAEQTITITNVSGASQVMSGSGGGAGVFGGAQNCQGTTLAPGASCRMFYAFSPVAVGATPGSTSGSWNGQGFSLKFKGFGTPQFLITPTSLAFGQVKVGHTSKQQRIEVKNLANKPVVMSGAGGGAGVFGGAQDCQGETLNPGKACHMFYAFTPTAAGTVHGSTNGTWNGQAFSLTFVGTGQM